jgi:hypothetical protein
MIMKYKILLTALIISALLLLDARGRSGFNVSDWAEGVMKAKSEAAFKTFANIEAGTDFQAWDDDLDDIAALSPTDGYNMVGDGTDWQIQSKGHLQIQSKGHLDSRDYTNHFTAISAIGSTQGTYHILDAQKTTSSQAYPSTLAVVMHKGFPITETSDVSVDFAGPFSAGPYSCFVNFEPGDVTFRYNQFIYPEWWGAIGDGSTDCTVAIQSAFDAARPGDTIYFHRGTYLVSDQILSTAKTGITLKGGTRQGTAIQWSGGVEASKSVIKLLGCSQWIIDGIMVFGGTGDQPGYCMQITSAGDPGSGSMARNVIQNCSFQAGSVAQLMLGDPSGQDRNGDHIIVRNCNMSGLAATTKSQWGIVVGNANTVSTRITDTIISAHSEGGVKIERGARATTLDNLQVDSNTKRDIYIANTVSSDVIIQNMQVEKYTYPIIDVQAAETSNYASATVTIDNLNVTNNGTTNRKIINYEGSGVLTLRNCTFAGEGIDPNGEGTHDGSSNVYILSDSGKSWTTDEFVGDVISNDTDTSWGIVLSNTATTVTAFLQGGTENLWDASDAYTICHYGEIYFSTDSGAEGPGVATLYTSGCTLSQGAKFNVRTTGTGAARWVNLGYGYLMQGASTGKSSDPLIEFYNTDIHSEYRSIDQPTVAGITRLTEGLVKRKTIKLHIAKETWITAARTTFFTPLTFPKHTRVVSVIADTIEAYAGTGLTDTITLSVQSSSGTEGQYIPHHDVKTAAVTYGDSYGELGPMLWATGTATVSSGATTTGNIAHGLSIAPRAQDINVVPTNSLGDAAKYYISSVDATNFVITVDADPGATTATFGWNIQPIQGGSFGWTGGAWTGNTQLNVTLTGGSGGGNLGDGSDTNLTAGETILYVTVETLGD